MDIQYVKEVFEEIRKDIKTLKKQINHVELEVEECKATLQEAACVETAKVMVFQRLDNNFNNLRERVTEIETFVYGEDDE